VRDALCKEHDRREGLQVQFERLCEERDLVADDLEIKTKENVKVGARGSRSQRQLHGKVSKLRSELKSLFDNREVSTSRKVVVERVR
jgi:hypothetical protein